MADVNAASKFPPGTKVSFFPGARSADKVTGTVIGPGETKNGRPCIEVDNASKVYKKFPSQLTSCRN
ncbi:MAG: hypothetical protein GC191_09120 [Azospirillum sp.]|nr:hypothetical protein [Azospirillum sp.]